MKKTTVFFLIFCLIFTFSANAKNSTGAIFDEVNALSSAEKNKLLEQSEEFYRSYGIQLGFAFVDGTKNLYIEDYCDSFKNKAKLPDDCVVFTVNVTGREWYVQSYGDANDYYAYDVAKNSSLGYLKQDNFYEAAAAFIDGYSYNVENHDILGGTPWTDALIIGCTVALICAVIVMIILFSMMRSVKPKTNAREYIRRGSFLLTQSRDIYLFSHISRRAKPKSSGSSRSSGGRSSGGGRF
jgi:uncharacterized protein